MAPAPHRSGGPPFARGRAWRARLAGESGSAGLLLVATIVALVWANSPASGAYADLWGARVRLGPGAFGVDQDLRHWVNDGLMVVFFYVVGLEIRHELAVGALRDRRAAAVPAVAALAGMALPALLYALVAGGGEGARGWGIVMATDIAFVLGMLALLGPRVAPGVRVFLLTLAIVDDLGAIAVIAVFYAEGVDVGALAAAAGILLVVAGLRRLGPDWRGPAYFVAGLALWYATLRSGVHPTVAGVALGALTAVRPTVASPERSANERFRARLGPWTVLVVVPLFALANAGVPLGDGALSRALGSSVTLGVVVGLVAGKALGVGLCAAIVVRRGVGPFPEGMRAAHLPGAATLAGIGFTVSLFVADLAFTDPALQDEAKVGVLVASLVAALVGGALLAREAARTARPSGSSDAISPAPDGSPRPAGR